IYTARVAQRTGVRRETLERDLDRSDYVPPSREPPPRVAAQPKQRQEWAAERLLLMVLITDPARVGEARNLVPEDDLHDPRHREIYAALAAPDAADAAAYPAGDAEDSAADEDDTRPRLSSAAAALYDELRARSSVEIVDADRSFRAAVADIQLEGLSVRHKFLDDQMREARDEQAKAAIAMEKYELKREATRLIESAALGFKASRRYRELLSNRMVPGPRTHE